MGQSKPYVKIRILLIVFRTQINYNCNLLRRNQADYYRSVHLYGADSVRMTYLTQAALYNLLGDILSAAVLCSFWWV